MSLSRAYNPNLAKSVWWNLLLLTIGAFLTTLAVSTATPHGFLSGGVMGSAMLVWYASHSMTAFTWYLILSVPIFVFGWFYVGRVFLLYTAYGSVCTFIFGNFMNFTIPIDTPLYAAVLAGAFNGAAGGIMLRTRGCGGGTDVIAVALKERWNVAVGQFSFGFNALLFAIAAFYIKLDMVIVSTIMVFITSATLEYVLGMFNQRKMVIVISEHGEEISEAIIISEKFGATMMRGKGSYSGHDKEILLTVTNNIALKRLENLVFSIDEHALFIVANTFYVSGGQFLRKVYGK